MSSLPRTTLTEFHHNGYRLSLRRIGSGGVYCAEVADTQDRHGDRNCVTYVDTTAGAALTGLTDRIERSRLLGISWRDDALQVLMAYRADQRSKRGW